MGIGRGTATPLCVIVVVAVAVLQSMAAAGSAAVDPLGGRPCFHVCFDQCVPRDEFWFCQFSCYHRCAGAGGGRAVLLAAPGRDCERSCAVSLCGQLRPGSKMMAACRDTCRKSYAVAACSRRQE